MSNPQDLQRLRTEIDLLDEQIVNLLNQRVALAKQTKAAKPANTPYDPAREANVITHALAANNGPLTSNELTTIYQAIITACRQAQE